MATTQFATPYPVTIDVQPATGERDKMSIGFRFILGIPHALLIGGLGYCFTLGTWWSSYGGILAVGALGAVASVCALVSWFAIMFKDEHPAGLQELCMFYLRWRTRGVAYLALFRDEYPPFGEGEYPATINVQLAQGPRDKKSVGLRIFYLIPHIIVLWFLSIAWVFTSIVAWFSLLLNGTYPESLYNFGMGVMRWSLRVEAYGLLLVDEFPPFSLD
jgi:hypothetical protein